MNPELKGYILLSVIKMLVVFTVVLVGVALLTLLERKVSAWMQNRRGPNRVGWAGLLQPAADGLKNILKEETFPAESNKLLFLLAPAMSFIPANERASADVADESSRAWVFGGRVSQKNRGFSQER